MQFGLIYKAIHFWHRMQNQWNKYDPQITILEIQYSAQSKNSNHRSIITVQISTYLLPAIIKTNKWKKLQLEIHNSVRKLIK